MIKNIKIVPFYSKVISCGGISQLVTKAQNIMLLLFELAGASACESETMPARWQNQHPREGRSRRKRALEDLFKEEAKPGAI